MTSYRRYPMVIFVRLLLAKWNGLSVVEGWVTGKEKGHKLWFPAMQKGHNGISVWHLNINLAFTPSHDNFTCQMAIFTLRWQFVPFKLGKLWYHIGITSESVDTFCSRYSLCGSCLYVVVFDYRAHKVNALYNNWSSDWEQRQPKSYSRYNVSIGMDAYRAQPFPSGRLSSCWHMSTCIPSNIAVEPLQQPLEQYCVCIYFN
jgi:hypothetical protein